MTIVNGIARQMKRLAMDEPSRTCQAPIAGPFVRGRYITMAAAPTVRRMFFISSTAGDSPIMAAGSVPRQGSAMRTRRCGGGQSPTGLTNRRESIRLLRSDSTLKSTPPPEGRRGLHARCWRPPGNTKSINQLKCREVPFLCGLCSQPITLRV